MSLGTAIAPYVPGLRRHARALVGHAAGGDALVQATLQALLGDEALRAGLHAEGRVALYRTFTGIWAGLCNGVASASRPAPDARSVAQWRLSRITPRPRQALLLLAIEDFSADEAGAIMGTSAREVSAMAEAAMADIAAETAARVLIIEDEPLIAMQLEALVVAHGHSVCGMVATRTQAMEALARERPGLVLADIQLADGSSGLDAVADILAVSDVPVIFITAFPERLLTGEVPEPTYLITKPFRESAVTCAIGQALFFRAPAVV